MGKLIIILAFAIVGAAQAYPKIIDKSSLVGWWTMDAVSGSTIQDSSGNGATGTQSSTTSETGRFGNARVFNGTTSAITCVHKANQLLTSGGTILAWIKPKSMGESSQGRIVDKATSASAGNGFAFGVTSTNTLRFQINLGTVITAGSDAITLSVWQHVAVTFTSGGLTTFYVNGVRKGTPASTAAASNITNTGSLLIGNLTTVRTFDGSIDDVRIYNRVLTATEIAQQYKSGVSNHGQ